MTRSQFAAHKSGLMAYKRGDAEGSNPYLRQGMMVAMSAMSNPQAWAWLMGYRAGEAQHALASQGVMAL